MRQLVTSFPRVGLHKAGAVYLEGREILIVHGDEETRIPVSDAEMGVQMGKWYIRRRGRLGINFSRMQFINRPEDPAALTVLKDMVEGRRPWEAASLHERERGGPTVTVNVQAPAQPEPWICNYCSKRNAPDRTTCWQCGGGR